MTTITDYTPIALPEPTRASIEGGADKIVVPLHHQYPTDDHALLKVREDHYAIFETHPPLVHRFQYLLPILPYSLYRVEEEWRSFLYWRGKGKRQKRGEVIFLKHEFEDMPRIKWSPPEKMPEALTRTWFRTGKVSVQRAETGWTAVAEVSHDHS